MPIGINVSSLNMPKGTQPEVRAQIALKISELLTRPGMTQEVLAKHCRVDQTIVSRWKSGQRTPGPDSLVGIAHLVPEDEKEEWFEFAGVPKVVHPRDITHRSVPLFKGKIAAGHGREVEGEIEKELPFPKEWFGPGSRIIALKVDGDSMAPLVNSGYYVLVDISQTDIKRLAGHMVAARATHGCTLKWLRKDSDTGFFQLIPQHVSEAYPVRTITPDNEHEFAILGRVVRWIGEPKPPKRGKS
ncbi:MAG TPA: XRE family transcriptional regulator [Candidatus Angelobacter sp.]|jgi:SOS-response transcriptional repressor LexA|nr:XRE family transcriptional regulator [Candidatus Angelobacter sp.]